MPGYSRWDRDSIIRALQADARRRGRPPTRKAWEKAPPRRRQRPTAETTARLFGSWSAAIIAAGLEPRPAGGQARERCQRGHDEWRTRPDGKRFCVACRRERQRRDREELRRFRAARRRARRAA